ncbi:uncharacterized protein LOC135492412 [Lineus longissimus]|uniref:uncharacterized protein LOC135492412 n=1 Tax=Lineus longissimus TaxID=88925 RepID=UPI002B4D1E92
MGQKVSQSPTEVADKLFDQFVAAKEYEGLEGVDFGYENLVFEGGGNKGIGYVGMIKVLDDLGLLKNIKRFAGASMGAVIATSLALGANSRQIFENFVIDLSKITSDGYAIDIFRSILKKYGWHPGKKLLKHFREECRKYTGNPDITFQQLYDLRGVELCLTVSNLSSCCVEYFHPKTTPDVSIALALRMSLSIPVLFRPMQMAINQSNPCYMVDGGLMNNYPITAYDGWFLDMEPNHSFFHMIDSPEDYFGKLNNKTLGAVVYDAFESELNEEIYFSREEYEKPMRPNTKLAREKCVEVDKLLDDKVQRAQLVRASKKFLSILSASDLDRSGSISLEEFIHAMKSCPKDVLEILFLRDHVCEDLFREIDVDKNGEITYNEFINYVQQKGLPLRHHMTATNQRNINKFTDFLAAIFESRDLMIRQLQAKAEDVERTIGIYTDYIGVTDFKLEDEDKVFGARQGWKATVAFLKERKEIMIGNEREVQRKRTIRSATRREHRRSTRVSLVRRSVLAGNLY